MITDKRNIWPINNYTLVTYQILISTTIEVNFIKLMCLLTGICEIFMANDWNSFFYQVWKVGNDLLRTREIRVFFARVLMALIDGSK